MKTASLILATVVIILLARPAKAAELVVSAAISLKDAFLEIASDFRKAQPGTEITFNFAGSGELSRQIERGAPVDVFASASRDEMARLNTKHLLINDSLINFARNTLVVVEPEGQRPISSLNELAKKESIAIGNPVTVPAGRYAREALSRCGIYDKLQAEQKLVFAESVRQVLTYVEKGSVDAGLVYTSDAANSRQAKVACQIPTVFTEPIIYPVSLIAGSRHVKLGRSFIDFLKTDAAARILRSKGFLPVNCK